MLMSFERSIVLLMLLVSYDYKLSEVFTHLPPHHTYTVIAGSFSLYLEIGWNNANMNDLNVSSEILPDTSNYTSLF